MKNEFNITGNTFNDKSGIININGVTNDFEVNSICSELKELNRNLNPDSDLYNAIYDLQKAIDGNDSHKISETVKRNAAEFGKSFFIGIASNTLYQYIRQFLP